MVLNSPHGWGLQDILWNDVRDECHYAKVCVQALESVDSLLRAHSPELEHRDFPFLSSGL